MKRALLFLLLPSIAFADGVSDEAERKFEEGMKAMDAGKYDVGCPMLADSYRLEPLPGALFTLAECEAKWKHLATSLEHYEGYLDQWEKMTSAQKSKQGSREKVARAQVEQLRKDVPEVTIVLPPNAASDLVIKRDDIAVTDISKPLRLDPGEHVFVVEDVHGKTKQTNVKLATGEKRKLALATPEQEAPPASAPPVTETPKSSGGSHMPLTITAGAIGLAGIAIGAITGGLALGDKSTVDAHCMGTTCDAQGLSAVSDGRTMGIVSTIGFIAGGVGIAAAILSFVTEPKKTQSAQLGVFRF